MLTWLASRRALLLIGLLVGGLLLGSLTLGLGPAGPANAPSRLFTVEPGSGVARVGQDLQRQGFIRSAWAFRVLTMLTGTEGQIKAGFYALKPSMTPREVLRRLVQGQSEAQRLTIPEGYSLRQIAGLLDEQGIGSGERFLSLASRAERFEARYSWLEALPEGASLEGFLFPDTYQVGGTRIPEEDLIGLMLSRFEQVGLKAWQAHSDPPLDLFRTVTLASIVELEAQSPPERPLIAGVFYNRLRLRMPLGSDPTVEYALGWKQGSKGLSFKDVKVASPYNTYRNPGLPPGPIANPGLASLEATMQPQETPLLYFVARGDGTHHFSRTYAEHLEAQRRLRR